MLVAVAVQMELLCFNAVIIDHFYSLHIVEESEIYTCCDHVMLQYKFVREIIVEILAEEGLGFSICFNSKTWITFF